MRLYSYFDTLELYNIRCGLGKFFFGFFAACFARLRSRARFFRAARPAAHRAASKCTGAHSIFRANCIGPRSSLCTAAAARTAAAS